MTSGPEMGIALPVTYTYDNDNRPTGITYPDGSVVTRAFDVRNQLTQVSDAGTVILARAYGVIGK